MPSSVLVKRISYQNHFASIIIQRGWRGYKTRCKLWEYGGARYEYCVLKVQCAYRIHLVRNSDELFGKNH
jgi:hypothetical protein